MRDSGKLKLLILVIAFSAAALCAAGCDCSSASLDDDDDDDDNNGGGGGGGGGNNVNGCDESFAYGDGLGQYQDGAWVDATPDVYSQNWRLNDAAWVNCEQLIFVGYDKTKNKGVALTYEDSAYVVDALPDIGDNWELTAIDAYGDTAVAVGGDWESGEAVIMTKVKEEWELAESLPYVSDDWWLTGVSLTSSDSGWAVGLDYDRGEPVLMKLSGGEWNTQAPPAEGGIDSYYLYAIDMYDKENGLAVGRNLDNSKGVAIWMTNGVWYFPVTPQLLGDNWDLADVALGSSGRGILIGRRFDISSGVILEFDEGPLASMAVPDLSDDWTLSGAAVNDGDMLACGYEREHGEGFVLRYTEDEWRVDGRLPFKTLGIVYGD